MTESRIDILFFGAHADDIEIACGGTVAWAVEQGHRVGMVDLTRGEMGTRGTPETRRKESAAAARALQAEFRETLDFGDGNLRTGREEELEVIRILRSYRPRLVVAPYIDDRHPDHHRAGQLVTEASFYAGLQKIETGQAPHRPQAVIYHMLAYTIEPTFIVDVTATWNRKMKSLAAYKSQFYNPKSKERATIISQKSFLDRIEGRARHFGAIIGAAYGEAFFSKQPPKITNLVDSYSGREVE